MRVGSLGLLQFDQLFCIWTTFIRLSVSLPGARHQRREPSLLRRTLRGPTQVATRAPQAKVFSHFAAEAARVAELEGSVHRDCTVVLPPHFGVGCAVARCCQRRNALARRSVISLRHTRRYTASMSLSCQVWRVVLSPLLTPHATWNVSRAALNTLLAPVFDIHWRDVIRSKLTMVHTGVLPFQPEIITLWFRDC